MYGRNQAAAQTDRLPEPRNAYDVPNTHNLLVPPQQTPGAFRGGIEDLQGPRHSALGLEGLDMRDTPKAPTVRRGNWYG